MRCSFPHYAAAAVVLLLVNLSPARAGQVRVGVGGGLNTFSPSTVNANVGDQVVWIWAGGSHTVTSGNPATATQLGDGKFRSNSDALGRAGLNYFWKVTGSGSVSYYCFPHAPGMAGTIAISAGGAAVADFRITEVEFSAAGGLDRVQVTNLGTATGQLGRYRVSSQTGAATAITRDPETVTSGSAVTLHLNASGTDNATDLFFSGEPALGTAGSFALYVPNNTTAIIGSLAPASLTDANQLVDYVEWGANGQAASPNQATAVSAALWTNGGVVETTSTLPNSGAGYSISFCGARTDHGPGFWQISLPNFGASAPCTTPTRTATWGRIKSLYR